MRACNRNARQHFRRATFYRNLKEKCRGPEPGTTLCASLRSKCTSPFHKSHFIQEKCGAQSEHPDQAPAFTATVRTPQCGHTVRGKTEIIQQKNQHGLTMQIPCPVATNGSTWGCSPRSKWLQHNHNTIVVGLRSAYISYIPTYGAMINPMILPKKSGTFHSSNALIKVHVHSIHSRCEVLHVLGAFFDSWGAIRNAKQPAKRMENLFPGCYE